MTRGAAPRRARLPVACALLLPVLVACNGDMRTATYSAAAAQQLRADVARVRDAAEDGRQRAARVALHRLTRHVAAAQASGELPAGKARRILLAADLVAADIAALPKQTTAGKEERARPRRKPTGDGRGGAGRGRQEKAAHAEGRDSRRRVENHRDDRPDDGGEKPEGWEAHKGEGSDGEKPEGWEAHKKED